MNLQPLGDRLIVEVLDEEELTVSGIVLPDTAKEKPQRGKVLVVGPGARNQETGEYIQMDVAEGDEVGLLEVRRDRVQARHRRGFDLARVGCAREGRQHGW
jgi:co-chaperonin GroES (HSP10)